MVDLLSSSDSKYTNESVHTLKTEDKSELMDNIQKRLNDDFPVNNNNLDQNQDVDEENKDNKIEKNQIDDFDKLKINSGDISISSEIKINETSQNSSIFSNLYLFLL